jgi:RimJ/RimL family protein N-acetyltransferase
MTGADSLGSATGAAGTRVLLTSARLMLRQLEAGDAPFLLALMNDTDYHANIGDRGLRSVADAGAYICRVVADSYRQHGYGMYLVLRRSDGCPVGIAGLVNRPTLEDVDIGFAVARDHRGEGYASEAGAVVVRHAARDLGLRRLVGIVSPGNEASIRVLQKLGLRFEARVRLTPDEAPLRLYARDLRLDPPAEPS